MYLCITALVTTGGNNGGNPEQSRLFATMQVGGDWSGKPYQSFVIPVVAHLRLESQSRLPADLMAL